MERSMPAICGRLFIKKKQTNEKKRRRSTPDTPLAGTDCGRPALPLFVKRKKKNKWRSMPSNRKEFERERERADKDRLNAGRSLIMQATCNHGRWRKESKKQKQKMGKKNITKRPPVLIALGTLLRPFVNECRSDGTLAGRLQRHSANRAN